MTRRVQLHQFWKASAKFQLPTRVPAEGAVLSAGLPLRARLFGVVVVGTGVLVLAVAILVQLARAPGLTAAPPLASLDGDSQATD